MTFGAVYTCAPIDMLQLTIAMCMYMRAILKFFFITLHMPMAARGRAGRRMAEIIYI